MTLTKLRDGQLVTVDATHGSVYEGDVAVQVQESGSGDGPAPLGGGAPAIATQLLVNSPGRDDG